MTFDNATLGLSQRGLAIDSQASDGQSRVEDIGLSGVFFNSRASLQT